MTPQGTSLNVRERGLNRFPVVESHRVFIGSSGDPNELRVLDVPKFSSGQAPTVATYNATATIRGLAYDWHFDRLFAVTSSTFLIFRPG
jgi:hypothetical protein